MAKRFVQISLATKLRVLFGMGVLAIIAAALLVPWYFMELLSEQGVQSPAAEISQLRLDEWLRKHPKEVDHASEVAMLYTQAGQRPGRKGPAFVRIGTDLTTEPPLDSAGQQALSIFVRNARQHLAVTEASDQRDRTVYRCFRAVRIGTTCQSCHGPSAPIPLQFQPGELVGMIELTMPAADVSGPLLWLTRGAFVVGGGLAALLAVIVFAVVIQRLILRPMQHLRDVADKVTEGDLAVRSEVRTGDELQRLGESFNEMLSGIGDQHNKLRKANRALDLKLSELSEANIALYQANKIKTEFLANVSHELRTPLNSIIGFADLLADWSDERTCRYGKNIRSSAKHLLGMINDLLHLARIEAGKAEVQPARVSVSDICQTLLALMKPLADEKQLQMTAALESDLPFITTDPGKLQQILYNLLSNAVKFTPAGGKIVLAAKPSVHQRAGKEVREVAVAVADNGPGISEADQQHIFEKFYQADRTLTREAAGTGLGLAIARELAELLGGRLELNSAPGHGAEFTVFLPVDVPVEPTIPADFGAESETI